MQLDNAIIETRFGWVRQYPFKNITTERLDFDYIRRGIGDDVLLAGFIINAVIDIKRYFDLLAVQIFGRNSNRVGIKSVNNRCRRRKDAPRIIYRNRAGRYLVEGFEINRVAFDIFVISLNVNVIRTRAFGDDCFNSQTNAMFLAFLKIDGFGKFLPVRNFNLNRMLPGVK